MSARILTPKGGGLCDPTLVGEENETPLIRVWKPLFSGRVLKTLRGTPKGNRTISTGSGLGLLQMVSELDTARCASKEARPQSGSGDLGNECQRRRGTPKGGGL